MSWTATEEERIEAIETAINQALEMLQHAPSLKQLRSLNNIRQQDIEDLQTRMTALESIVSLLRTQVNAIVGA